MVGFPVKGFKVDKGEIATTINQKLKAAHPHRPDKIKQLNVGGRIWRGVEFSDEGSTTYKGFTSYGLTVFPVDLFLESSGIIPEGVIKKLHTGLRPEMYDKGVYGTDTHKDFPLPGIANRYQWDIITPDGDQFKSGVGGQGLYISAPRDAVVAFFSTGTQRDEALGAWVARHITQTFG